MGALGMHWRARRRAMGALGMPWRARRRAMGALGMPWRAHRRAMGLSWVPLGHWHGHTTYVLLNWGFRGLCMSLALAFAWPRDSLGLVLGMGVFDLGLERHDAML